MYVHIIHDQSDDIINKQQCMQKTGNRCVKVKIRRIRGDCDLPSILGNSVGPAVIVSRAPPTLIILELTENRNHFKQKSRVVNV